MRSFEHNFGWADALRARHEVTIVVGTVAQRGGKVSGNMVADRIRSLIPSNVADALPPSWIGGALFDHLPGLLEKAMSRAFHDRLTPAMIDAVLPGAHIAIEEPIAFGWFERPQLDRPGAARDPYAMQMLYRIWRTDLSRRTIELDRGERFDVVVRMRPDRPLSGLDDRLMAGLTPGLVYVEAVRDHDGFMGDQFAMADSATMDVYGDFFPRAYAKARAGRWSDIHHEFYDDLHGAGLTVRSYNPMLDYAPERLLEVSDVLAALARRGADPVRGLYGYDPADAAATESIARSVVLADQLFRQEVALGDPATLQRLAALLDGFVPQRDGGMFHFLAANCGAGLPAQTRLLCSVIALLAMPDPRLLHAVYTYIVEFCVQLEALAAQRGTLPTTAAALIQACLEVDDPHPLHGVLAAFLDQPGWRGRAGASLQALMDLLRAEDPGLWLRIVGHLRDRGEAERLLRQIVAHAPLHCLSWLRLANLLVEDGRPTEAAEPAHRAAALEPNHAEVLAQVATILAQAGDLAGAEQAARHAAAIDQRATP